MKLTQYKASCQRIFAVFFAVSGIAMINTLALAAQDTINPITINVVNSHAKFINPLPSYILFNESTHKLSGWNHTQTFSEEFIGLKLSPENYQTEEQALNQAKNFSTTLVKKLGDWQHQHGNGIIADISAAQLRFSQLSGIRVLLKIDRLKSTIPDAKQLIETYQAQVNPAQLATLDDAHVYLSVALFGPTNQIDKSTFNADYLLKLDANNQLDQWLAIYIPLTTLSPFMEQNYEQKSISLSQAKQQLVSGLRITAETASTKVIRNLLLDKFDKNTPKLFKEIALEIKYLALTKTQKKLE